MRMRHVRWMVLIAALGFAAACGGEKGEKVVIMDPSNQLRNQIAIYAEAGGLGGTSAEVNAGEFARILERKTVGADVRGANPGEWVRIRTIIQPREGWITPDHTRPVPDN
jgi:hypothetical protein